MLMSRPAVVGVVSSDLFRRDVAQVCMPTRVWLKMATRTLLPTLMKKRAQLTATTLRGRPAPYKAALVSRFEQEALPLLADDDGGDAAADGAPRLRVVVDRAFAGLAALQDAHEYMESNANAGKIVIELD